MPTNMKVNAEQITLNLANEVRARRDPDVVQDYAEKMKAGEEFPRLDVFKKPDTSPAEYILTDGDARLAAYALNKVHEIPVTLHEGGMEEAREAAAGANATHGRARSNADKERAVRLLLEQPDWYKKSDRAVGEKARVSHHFVADVRKGMVEAGKAKEQTHRENKKGKKVKVTRRKKKVALFDFRQMEKDFGAILRSIDDIATAYPEEKKVGDYRLVKQAADKAFELYVAWAKRLVKAKPASEKPAEAAAS